MKLQTLYKRRVDGGTQEWTLEISGGKYRSISGITSGSLVTSRWTVCKGKNIGKSNETTPNEQAAVEARSKWKHKHTRGYAKLVTNVDTTGFFKPMLARKFEDVSKDLGFPVLIQPKLDGMRCIARCIHGTVSMTSRNGKPIVSVPHICDALTIRLPHGTILDGEIYNHDFKHDFNRIMSLARKTQPNANDLRESTQYLQYHVYDIPSEGDKPCIERMAIMQLARCSGVHIVETHLCHTRAGLDKYYAEFLAAGYEGGIIRMPHYLYENKRSKGLLKRKDFMDKEFKIIDIKEGVGNRSGTIGHFVCEIATTPKMIHMLGINPKAKTTTFHANAKGSHVANAGVLLHKNDYIGRMITVEFFEYTPAGIPRFPHAKAIRDYE